MRIKHKLISLNQLKKKITNSNIKKINRTKVSDVFKAFKTLKNVYLENGNKENCLENIEKCEKLTEINYNRTLFPNHIQMKINDEFQVFLYIQIFCINKF